MAEFVDIMMIAERACKRQNGCDDCPFCIDRVKCALGTKSMSPDWPKIERKAIEWAKEHPEPRYPTWKEWAKNEFPFADFEIGPCHFARCEREIMGDKNCNECLGEPIPEDIAVKLGIKKIGGDKP